MNSEHIENFEHTENAGHKQNSELEINSQSGRNRPALLVFGAHPDDIEFGCGGVIAGETRRGRRAHFVVTSLGEAGTNGTPEQRAAEASQAAALLGASIEFIELDGDSHLEIKAAHAIKLAEIIRRTRPFTVLARTSGQGSAKFLV